MFFMIVIFGFSIISMYYLYNWEENERNFLRNQYAQYETIFKGKSLISLSDTMAAFNIWLFV